MIILLYLFLAVLLLWGIRCRREGWDDPFERKTTNAIKGFFIALVFLRHIFGYIVDGGWVCSGFFDRVFLYLNRSVGQLLVVMFLFYSGYGVMTGVLTRGQEYVQTMPKRRILVTLLNFDIAVLVFFAVNMLWGVRQEIDVVGFSLVGWLSIGNSNWYIFDILVLYSVFWFAFRFGGQFMRPKWLLLVFTIMVTGVALWLSFVKPGWWSGTIMAFPLGSFYSMYKFRIIQFLQRYYKISLSVSLVLMIILETVSFFMSLGIWYNLVAVTFATTVVILSMKIRVGNAALIWAGVHLFPLYIYQRLPMIVVSRFLDGNLVGIGMWAYILICVLVTCVFGFIYRFFAIKLNV